MSILKYEVVTAPLVFPHGDGVLIVAPQSTECPKCHRQVRLLVSRLGETVCLGCAPAVQTSVPR